MGFIQKLIYYIQNLKGRMTNNLAVEYKKEDSSLIVSINEDNREKDKLVITHDNNCIDIPALIFSQKELDELFKYLRSREKNRAEV